MILPLLCFSDICNGHAERCVCFLACNTNRSNGIHNYGVIRVGPAKGKVRSMRPMNRQSTLSTPAMSSIASSALTSSIRAIYEAAAEIDSDSHHSLHYPQSRSLAILAPSAMVASFA